MNWTMPYPWRSRRDSVRRISMYSEPGNESFFCALRPIPRILSLSRRDYMSQVRIGEPSRGKTISGWYRARMRIGMVRVHAVYNRLRRIPKTHFLMAISPAALGTVVQQHNQCAGVYATVLTPREVSVGFVVERGMAESAATEWTPRGVFPIIFYRQGGHTNMAEIQAIATADDAAPVSGVVPMIRVADVLKSAEFYRSLGFEIGNAVPREG